MHPKLAYATAFAAVILLLGSSSCKRNREYNGIGGWVLGKTVRSQAGGICEPQAGLVWCGNDPLSNRTVSLGGQAADIGLYFASNDPKAPLVEIVLDVSACDVHALTRWMKSTFGTPSQSQPSKLFWGGWPQFCRVY